MLWEFSAYKVDEVIQWNYYIIIMCLWYKKDFWVM